MPMNPGLFATLKRAFAVVKIAKEGEAAQFDVKTGSKGGRYAAMKQGQGGEEYRICCPFCSDTTHRLWINHRWGTTDELQNVSFGSGLLQCFNDGCDLNRHSADSPARRTRQEEFKVMLSPLLRRSLMPNRVQSVAQAAPKKAAQLPEVVVPLDTLPLYHPANHYLLGRGYTDPVKVAQTWNLMYCPEDRHPHVTNRIIIPAYYEGLLVGWQARYIGKPPGKHIPKYFTMPGFAKSNMLYNYNNAARYDFGLLSEGVTDVWSLGNQGVASLGASLSQHQIQLLRSRWQNTGIAVVADGDVMDTKEKADRYTQMMERLRAPDLFKWGVLEVRLPQGMDPGKFASSHLWLYIGEVAQAAGYTHDIFYSDAYAAACHDDVQR